MGLDRFTYVRNMLVWCGGVSLRIFGYVVCSLRSKIWGHVCKASPEEGGGGRRMEEYGRDAGFGVVGVKGWGCSDRIFSTVRDFSYTYY